MSESGVETRAHYMILVFYKKFHVQSSAGLE